MSDFWDRAIRVNEEFKTIRTECISHLAELISVDDIHLVSRFKGKDVMDLLREGQFAIQIFASHREDDKISMTHPKLLYKHKYGLESGYIIDFKWEQLHDDVRTFIKDRMHKTKDKNFE